MFHPLLPCQALGQALVLCHQGRGGFGWLFWPHIRLTSGLRIKSAMILRHGRIQQVLSVALSTPRCGYCLEASMTAAVRPALWIPAYAGMTGGVVLLSPSAPVSGTGTGFDSSPIKGEGILLVVLACCLSVRLTSGLTSLRSRCASVCAFSAKA